MHDTLSGPSKACVRANAVVCYFAVVRREAATEATKRRDEAIANASLQYDKAQEELREKEARFSEWDGDYQRRQTSHVP